MAWLPWRMTGCWVDSLGATGRLVGRLAGWLAGWLATWLAGLLIGRTGSAVWLVGRTTGCLVGVAWSVGRLVIWLAGWLDDPPGEAEQAVSRYGLAELQHVRSNFGKEFRTDCWLVYNGNIDHSMCWDIELKTFIV